MTAHQDVAGVVKRLLDIWGSKAWQPEDKTLLDAVVSLESLSKALSEAETAYSGLMKAKEAFRAEAHNNAARANAAESRLVEAMKVIEPFAAMPGCYEMHEDDVIYKNAGAALTAGDFRAARRFLNAGKE